MFDKSKFVELIYCNKRLDFFPIVIQNINAVVGIRKQFLLFVVSTAFIERKSFFHYGVNFIEILRL